MPGLLSSVQGPSRSSGVQSLRCSSQAWKTRVLGARILHDGAKLEYLEAIPSMPQRCTSSRCLQAIDLLQLLFAQLVLVSLGLTGCLARVTPTWFEKGPLIRKLSTDKAHRASQARKTADCKAMMAKMLSHRQC